MKISLSKTREQFPLSEKKILKKTIKGTISKVLFIGVFWFVAVISKVLDSKVHATSSNAPVFYTILALSLMFLICILSYFYQRWYFATYYYDLTPDFVVIKKGPITPQEITIPYERIQDVYVDQDIWDRIFGLYDVHISSATISSGFAAHIDGVEKQAAEGLRDIILKTVQQKIGKPKSPVAS